MVKARKYQQSCANKQPKPENLLLHSESWALGMKTKIEHTNSGPKRRGLIKCGGSKRLTWLGKGGTLERKNRGEQYLNLRGNIVALGS